MNSSFEWQFGGVLRQVPPAVAWAVLGLAAVAGMFLVVWLYRRTLRELPQGPRIFLTILRTAIVAAALFCLAGPERVERSAPAPPRRELAVVVDRSDSMAAADYRGRTRLASATRLWQQRGEDIAKAYPIITHYRFAKSLESSPSFDEAVKAKISDGGETHLYGALESVLEKAPTAIVCLTDGLNTTLETSAGVAAEAQRRGVPLYFAVGTNRSRAEEMLNLREIRVPARVLRQTKFPARALIDISASSDRTVPVELWSGETMLASAELPARAGRTLIPFAAEIEAGEAGPMPLEFRVGRGNGAQSALSTTQVIAENTLDVLYYQGALQWGYRFLLAALESDPSFRVTSILNPALGVQITTSVGQGDQIPDLPESAAELKPFQIVVLAHAFADHLTPGQQAALVEYVRQGGGILFIAPESEATARFAGTALEEMLPVVFEPPGTLSAEEIAERNFRRELSGAGNLAAESLLMGADSPTPKQDLPPLLPFTVPSGAGGASTSKLFHAISPNDLPKFGEYAKVRASKPGAEILAVRNFEDGPPRILLARQQFGNGFAAVLATDLLWRWRMSLPSGSHAVEKFWQQLLLSLSPPAGHGLRLARLTEFPSANAPVTVRIEGARRPDSLAAETISPSGQRHSLGFQPAPGGDGWLAVFTPAETGRWQIRTADADGNRAALDFPVVEKLRTSETVNLPPDLEGLRRLAESTGGGLIEDASALAAGETSAPAETRRQRPVWNSPWLFALLLGLYGTELVSRRIFRLL